jgi:uncharacterized protein YndB with AHSA1/START domain
MMAAETRPKVTVTRHFNATPERVFDAWLDPKLARRWLFATPNGEMIRVEIDPRVGGRFIFVDRRDGEDIEHTGQYLQIDRPTRLVFTFAVPKFSTESTRVDVQIDSAELGCDLTLTHEGVLPDYLERTASGWRTILEGLAKAAEEETSYGSPPV